MTLSSRKEAEKSALWSPYQVDIDRILHSKAYARYADKTQVVYLFHHDHIASRGLHVQLVSSLARAIGRQIGLDLDLLEAISLGHDIGHAPFGHEGERYLGELSCQSGLGHFSHSRQSCRIASFIEPMNLTLATLDGFLCHDGGMRENKFSISLGKGWEEFEQQIELRVHEPDCNLLPATHEAALVKIADTISYLERDLSDAITLGLIDPSDPPGELFQVGSRRIAQTVAADVVSIFERTGQIGLSPAMFATLAEIRTFNYENIYYNEGLKSESKKIQNAYQFLFEYLVRDWKGKGRESVLWRYFLHNKKSSYIEQCGPEQCTLDYIAGMTDGYFLRLFHELFVPGTIKVADVLPFS